MFSPESKKRALLIGINYYGTNNQLHGCINDVINLEGVLKTQLHFTCLDITTLTDNNNIDTFPSKNNIKNAITDMVEWANNNPNSELWFSYSGHGYYITDQSGDEIDGKDEVICPINPGGVVEIITDDWLKANFIDKLNDDVKLFILMDCCHSGTVFDIQEENPDNINKRIVMISGCRDNQVSMDAYFRDEQSFQGALTHNFIKTCSTSSNITTLYTDLQYAMQEQQYTQMPKLSHTGRIDGFQRFYLSK